MTIEVSEQTSNRIKDRVENLNFSLNEAPLSGSFSHNIEYLIPNSNGKIEFFINLDSDHISEIYFKTNIHGPELAYLDVACELMSGKNLSKYHLDPREVESFLRDKNNIEAYPSGQGLLSRIFGFIPFLYNSLIEKAPSQEGGFVSPDVTKSYKEIKENHRNEDFSNFKKLEKWQQEECIEIILNRYIRPSLQADGGDAHCTFFDEGMLAIAYSGNCVSCDSSLTSTIDYIQTVFREELSEPSFMVVTDS